LPKKLAEFFLGHRWSPSIRATASPKTAPVSDIPTIPITAWAAQAYRFPTSSSASPKTGEILAKGPCVIAGLLQKAPKPPAKSSAPTAGSATGRHWLSRQKTNYLFHHRPQKKDLNQDRRRENSSPRKPIENALKTSRFILNALVVGDKRKIHLRAHRPPIPQRSPPKPPRRESSSLPTKKWSPTPSSAKLIEAVSKTA